MRELLGTLPPREEAMMRMRFGIGHEDEDTLENIGKCFGVTRERVRQASEKTASLWTDLRYLFANDHWLLVAILNFVLLVALVTLYPKQRRIYYVAVIGLKGCRNLQDSFLACPQTPF